MKITHHVEGNYHLVSHGDIAWQISEGRFGQLMGLYNAKETAIAAAEWFNDKELGFLAARVCMNQNRTITQLDLDEYLKEVNRVLA